MGVSCTCSETNEHALLDHLGIQKAVICWTQTWASLAAQRGPVTTGGLKKPSMFNSPSNAGCNDYRNGKLVLLQNVREILGVGSSWIVGVMFIIVNLLFGYRCAMTRPPLGKAGLFLGAVLTSPWNWARPTSVGWRGAWSAFVPITTGCHVVQASRSVWE